MFIETQAVPLFEEIEQKDRKAEPHLEIRPNSATQMFQFANLRKQRKDGFEQHSLIAFAAPADFLVFRLIYLTPKASASASTTILSLTASTGGKKA